MSYKVIVYKDIQPQDGEIGLINISEGRSGVNHQFAIYEMEGAYYTNVSFIPAFATQLAKDELIEAFEREEAPMPIKALFKDSFSTIALDVLAHLGSEESTVDRGILEIPPHSLSLSPLELLLDETIRKLLIKSAQDELQPADIVALSNFLGKDAEYYGDILVLLKESIDDLDFSNHDLDIVDRLLNIIENQ